MKIPLYLDFTNQAALIGHTGRQATKYLFGTVLVLLAAISGAAAAEPGDLLAALKSPLILRGDEQTAYRDPLIFREGETFYLFYSYVREEEDHLIYWYVAFSKSKDLVHWTSPKIVTPKGQDLNFASPGNVFRFGDEWLMGAQTYPIVNFRRGDKLRFCDDRARLWLFHSKDLENWGNRELMRVKGPDVGEADLGKMIDVFFLRDRDVPGKWWCFWKQNGALHCSWSMDLKTWTVGTSNIARGENGQVFVDDSGQYVLIYAPKNGIGVKRSPDLVHWHDEGILLLGQKDWPWCETRLTAGYVADFRDVPGVGKYLMVWHSMGPGKKKSDANVNANCHIGIAWSDDLKTWSWPGKPAAMSETSASCPARESISWPDTAERPARSDPTHTLLCSTSLGGDTTEAVSLGQGSGTQKDRDLLLARRVGFGRNATGGLAGATHHVTTAADDGPGSLREALARPEPLWIVFDGDYTIALGSGLPVGSHKTLDGRGRRVTLTGHNVPGLVLDEAVNVVVENLIFHDFGDTARTKFNDKPDAVLIENHARDVWIDHCSLSTAGDKLIAVAGGATDVTVSWCRFEDQEQVFQVGNQATQEADAETRITVHHCFFDSTGYRHPVVSYGKVHAFNNYLRRWKQYGMRAQRTGQLASEANIFEAGESRAAVKFNTPGSGWNDPRTRFDKRPGYVRSVGDWRINRAQIKTNEPGEVFEPGTFYRYQADPADETLRSKVSRWAGWQPTAAGQ